MTTSRRGFLGLLGSVAATAVVGAEGVKQFGVGQYNDVKFFIGLDKAPARLVGGGFSQALYAVRDVFSAEIWFSSLPILRFDQFGASKKREELERRQQYDDYMSRFGV